MYLYKIYIYIQKDTQIPVIAIIYSKALTNRPKL